MSDTDTGISVCDYGSSWAAQAEYKMQNAMCTMRMFTTMLQLLRCQDVIAERA